MKIELNDSEIKDAVAAYVATQGVNTDGKDVKVNLRAGRGENGYSAEIEVAASEVIVTDAPTEKTIVDNTADDQQTDDSKDDGPEGDDSLFQS